MLAIRIEPELEKSLAALAKQSGKSKSELAREAIRRYVFENALAVEARRQSLLVSGGADEQAALDLIEATMDTDGWN